MGVVLFGWRPASSGDVGGPRWWDSRLEAGGASAVRAALAHGRVRLVQHDGPHGHGAGDGCVAQLSLRSATGPLVATRWCVASTDDLEWWVRFLGAVVDDSGWRRVEW